MVTVDDHVCWVSDSVGYIPQFTLCLLLHLLIHLRLCLAGYWPACNKKPLSNDFAFLVTCKGYSIAVKYTI